jgi:RsiW-degrading membrane proteinase PrsW (M82 family)
MQVGITRAFTAVPAHAMFGVMMGYWLGKAKFVPSKRKKYLLAAFIYPFLFHGFYDFILMSGKQILLILFIPFVIYMVYRSHRRMKNFEGETIFNPDKGKKQNK